jgi:hypothetical protein
LLVKNVIDELGQAMKIHKRCGVCRQVAKGKRRCFVCREVGCAGVGGRVHCPVMKKWIGPNIDDGIVVSDRPKKKRRKRQCQVCFKYGTSDKNCSIGTSNKEKCKYFYINEKPKE